MGIVREVLRSPADLPVLVQAKVCALAFDGEGLAAAAAADQAVALRRRRGRFKRGGHLMLSIGSSAMVRSTSPPIPHRLNTNASMCQREICVRLVC